ncbi:MAG TPA: c-type cytochrome [Gammaproteobacteria bacterium]|nr:c-type cytochrome [Gammaproteobacteria bacterium]
MGVRLSGVVMLAGMTVGMAAACAAGDGEADDEVVLRGRHLVLVGGCNDCHTAGFAESGGKVPEDKWLMGSPLGFHGPWGTTYAANLRLFMQHRTLDEWIDFAHREKLRPPMPYWALHEMSRDELAAIYAFVRSLEPMGEPVPEYQPPGESPKGPAVEWPAPPGKE